MNISDLRYYYHIDNTWFDMLNFEMRILDLPETLFNHLHFTSDYELEFVYKASFQEDTTLIIPKAFSYLPIVKLELRGLNLIYLQDLLNIFIHVKIIKINYCTYKLPLDLSSHNNLLIIDLRNNMIDINNFKFRFNDKLEELDLSFTNIKRVPEELKNVKNIRLLKMHDCGLTAIPKWFENFVEMEYLVLSSNRISTIPDIFNNYKKLYYLNIGNNKLKTLPISVSNLMNLEDINLYGNLFESIPEVIYNLPHLKKLDMNDNKIITISKKIKNLPHLEVLILNNNLINKIGKEVMNLKRLKWLDLRKNKIEEIYIKNTKKLNMGYLALKYNNLTNKSIDKLIENYHEKCIII